MGRPVLLVVDDDPAIRKLVRRVGEADGCDVLEAGDGGEGLRQFYERKPHLVILDVKLPGLDGWDLLRRVRELASTPVLMLTGNSSEADKVRGLRDGADDYVTKPFAARELSARIEALLRRAAPAPEYESVQGDELLQVDFAQRRASVAGKELPLTPTEFALAAALTRHPGQVLSHDQLLEMVWGSGAEGSRPMVKLYIGYLRRKLREAGAGEPIETVRGCGYRYRPPAD